MMFQCHRCAACCRELIVKFAGCDIGLFLMNHEVTLFPSDVVSPCWAVGTKGKSRPRLSIKSYQLNVKDCPYIAGNSCSIYQRRPLVCRAHPLSIHADPTTMKIMSASIDTRCVTCKELGLVEGSRQVLGKHFSREILVANAAMTKYLAWMFGIPGQPVWLYDLGIKQWVEVTAEMALEAMV